MAWASSWKQRIRFTPLHRALVAADAIARWRPQPWPVQRDRGWRPGVSVLVPERGTPDLLAQCLQAALAALAQIREPSELLVVVNGAPEADYAELRARHPQVRWQFHGQALGYNGAIAAGLAAIEHDWVYLLNSDMIVAADALSTLLPYRQPEVFAVTSQIHFVDTQRRREETGWSDFRIDGAEVIMYEREPEASPLARGNLYPGGGSSLCRSAVLRRYVADSACYNPFYFEDAEWGARLGGGLGGVVLPDLACAPSPPRHSCSALRCGRGRAGRPPQRAAVRTAPRLDPTDSRTCHAKNLRQRLSHPAGVVLARIGSQCLRRATALTPGAGARHQPQAHHQ